MSARAASDISFPGEEAEANAVCAFLSAMMLHGVLEKFPRLRGGCIEQGAK
ncbi:MAG TPA: hypothetical protein VN754_07035 [Candidatus Binataceae bacterium]|nr:hypothetical protein [Candidatus Binataceae bacterium]